MFGIFISALITFLFASLFGYVVHRILHQKWSGRLYQAHMTHHIKLYPPTDFSSEKYRDSGKDNTVYIFGAFAIPLTLIPIVLWLCGIIAWPALVTSIIVMAVMSFLHSYLHDAFHIRNHWMYNIPILNIIYTKWVYIHMLHHIDQGKNYGIFLFFLDKLFGTYWEN